VTASSTRRRPVKARRIAVAAVMAGIAAAATLTGCGSGQITQTGTQVAPVPGTDVNAGQIGLRNLVIEYPGPEGYPAGADARLIVRIFNNGQTPITLTGVSADKATSVSLVGTPEVVPTTEAPPPPATTTAPASPEATATATAEPTATGEPTATATATAEPTPTATPLPTRAPEISITIPPQSFVLLVPGQGSAGYLRLDRLTQSIAPGESTQVTFTFSDGTTATVPVPLAPPTTEVPRATPIVEPGHAEPGH